MNQQHAPDLPAGAASLAVRYGEDLPALTALRGIAALFVFSTHVIAALPQLGADSMTGLLHKGYLWVDMFFVLSGFILTHVYRERLGAASRAGAYRDFFVARFARIYPLHLFVLAIMLAIEVAKAMTQGDLAVATPAFTGTRTPDSLLYAVLLLHCFGLTDQVTWNGPSWSIAAEWWAYLAFPLLIRLYGRLTPARCFAGFVLLAACLAVLGSGPLQMDLTYSWGFARGLLGFCAGMLVYRLYERGAAEKLFSADGAAVVCALAIAVLCHLGARDIFIVPWFALLLLAVARNRGAVRRVLQTRPLVRLGDISYSVYLLHVLVIFFVGAPLKRLADRPLEDMPFGTALAAAAVMVAATLLLAYATWRWVEMPARRAIRARFARARAVS